MTTWAPPASPMTSPVWCSVAHKGGRNLLRTPVSPDRPGLSHNHWVSPRELANSICDTLCRKGYQAMLVGGCVRDLQLGREPADYDVTTDATPDEVMRVFPETYAVGAQFGVVLVPGRDAGGNTVEVATFRSDIGYSDGRHPDQVRFSKSAQ